VTLLAFAADRRAAGRTPLSTSHARGARSSKPVHAAAAVDRWDRQTGGRTMDRYKDPALHTTPAVSSVAAVLILPPGE